MWALISQEHPYLLQRNRSSGSEVIDFRGSWTTVRRGHRGRRGHHRGRPKAHLTEALIVELPEAEANSVTINDEWVIDSGCNRHMGRALRWMTSYQPFEQPKTVQLGGSRAIKALGSGTAKLTGMLAY